MDAVAFLVGVLSAPALTLYAAIVAPKNPRRAARALSVLVALTALGLLSLMAYQWLMDLAVSGMDPTEIQPTEVSPDETSNVRPTTGIALVVVFLVGLSWLTILFIVDLWKGATWALLLLGLLSLLWFSWLVVRLGRPGTGADLLAVLVAMFTCVCAWRAIWVMEAAHVQAAFRAVRQAGSRAQGVPGTQSLGATEATADVGEEDKTTHLGPPRLDSPEAEGTGARDLGSVAFWIGLAILIPIVIYGILRLRGEG